MRRFLLAFSGLALASTAAIPQMLTLNYGADSGAFAGPPCDLIACTAAYGYRVLKTGATKAIQVRRSSDLSTQDIAFVGSNLDEASMITFCGANTCTVQKFYDQSGNAHDLSSGTGQEIIHTGTLSATINGHAVIKQPGGTSAYVTGNFAYCTSTTCAFFGVAQVQSGLTTNCSNSGNWFGTTEFTATYYIGVLSTASTACGGDGAQTASATYTNGANALFTLRYDNADNPKLKFYINGGTPGTNNTAGSPTISEALELGAVDNNSSSAVPIGSTFAEWLVFSAEPSVANSNLLGVNQASYWGQSWTTISQ